MPATRFLLPCVAGTYSLCEHYQNMLKKRSGRCRRPRLASGSGARRRLPATFESNYSLSVEPAQCGRAGIIRLKTTCRPVAHALVQAQGFRLVNAGLQSQHRRPSLTRVCLEVLQHHLSQPCPSELRAYVHALQLAPARAEFHAAAAGWYAIHSRDEKRRRLP